MNFIDDSIDMDEKSVYSHSVYNLISVIATIAAAVMQLSTMIFYFIEPQLGFYIYMILFYPILIALVLSYVYTISELLRGRYMSSILLLVLAVVMSLMLIVSIILQGVLLEKVYILPFVSL